MALVEYLTAAASGTWLRSSCSVRAVADVRGFTPSRVPLDALNRSPGQARLEGAFPGRRPHVRHSNPRAFARPATEDLKRNMAILGTRGHDCADRTMRLGARIPDLDIWSQGQVRRISCGGRSAPKDGRRLSTRKPSLLRPNRAKRQWSRRPRLQRWSQRTFLLFGSLPIAPSGARAPRTPPQSPRTSEGDRLLVNGKAEHGDGRLDSPDPDRTSSCAENLSLYGSDFPSSCHGVGGDRSSSRLNYIRSDVGLIRGKLLGTRRHLPRCLAAEIKHDIVAGHRERPKGICPVSCDRPSAASMPALHSR